MMARASVRRRFASILRRCLARLTCSSPRCTSYILITLFLLLIYITVLRLLSSQRQLSLPLKPRGSGLIILTGYPRSGSSFTHFVLAQSGGTFAVHEPITALLASGPSLVDPEVPMSRISSLMHAFMNCSFTQLAEFQQVMDRWPHYHPSLTFTRLRELKRMNNSVFTDRDSLTRTCLQSDRRIIKSFYVPMRRMESFLRTLRPKKRSEVRILYLVRDPRAIFNSRLEKGWCHGRCADLEILCQEMQQDLDAFTRLKPKLGPRLTRVRYEDLAKYPLIMAPQLYARLGLAYTKEIADTVFRHTQLNRTDPSIREDSLLRNSEHRISRWISSLNHVRVQRLQRSCVAPMRTLFYYPITNVTLFAIRAGATSMDGKLFGDLPQAISTKRKYFLI